MTPNRPDATCLIALRRKSPFSSGVKRCGSSPPSPEFDLRADPVHRDRERLVRLGADRSERHRAGDEPRRRSTRRGSTSSSGIGSLAGSMLEQAAQRDERVVLVVAQPLELVELRARRSRRTASCSVAIVAGFHLCSSPVRRQLVLAADGQQPRSPAPRPKPRAWRSTRLVAELVEADAADARRRAGEVPLDQRRDRARPPRRSARRGSSAPSRCPSWTSP